MTTELEPTGVRLPATREHDPLDAFQQGAKDDLILPARKLVQGVSRKADRSKAGQYWDEIGDTYKPEMLVSLIAMKRTRTLFQPNNFEAGPVCSSNDAITPRERVEFRGETTGPTCEECAFSQWASGDKGQAQACQFSYVLICYDLDDSEMFIFRVGGVSRGEWKRYLTKGQRDGTPAYAVQTIIGSESRTFPAGAAYVVTFKSGGPLPEDTVEFLREKAAEFQGVQITEREIGMDVEPEEVPFE